MARALGIQVKHDAMGEGEGGPGVAFWWGFGLRGLLDRCCLAWCGDTAGTATPDLEAPRRCK